MIWRWNYFIQFQNVFPPALSILRRMRRVSQDREPWGTWCTWPPDQAWSKFPLLLLLHTWGCKRRCQSQQCFKPPSLPPWQPIPSSWPSPHSHSSLSPHSASPGKSNEQEKWKKDEGDIHCSLWNILTNHETILWLNNLVPEHSDTVLDWMRRTGMDATVQIIFKLLDN